MSVEDIDKVMSEGLGRRYAFMGPLETAYLNADGKHENIRHEGFFVLFFVLSISASFIDVLL